jgi:hypothetical protein
LATKDELQTALDETNTKLDELSAALDTELTEIQAELKSIAGGDGVRGAAVDGLAKISARIDGLKERVSGLVTPSADEPEPVPDDGGDGGGAPV